MRRVTWACAFGAVFLLGAVAGADEAKITVGRIDDARFAEPSRDVSTPIARDDDPFAPELRRSPVRLVLLRVGR